MKSLWNFFCIPAPRSDFFNDMNTVTRQPVFVAGNAALLKKTCGLDVRWNPCGYAIWFGCSVTRMLGGANVVCNTDMSEKKK